MGMLSDTCLAIRVTLYAARESGPYKIQLCDI